MKNFTVFYKLGGIYDKLVVEAHTKEQARQISRVQAEYAHNSHGKYTVILILEDGEPNPYDELEKKFLTKKA